MKSIPLALLAACVAAGSANARTATNERTCQHYRDEHPGFLGAFAVTAHRAVWNGSGFDDEPRQFICPADTGGENLPPMRIDKMPSRARHRQAKGE